MPVIHSNKQLMGVQQSHQREKVNNIYIYILLQCHLIQDPPTTDRDCTNQTALQSTPRHREVMVGKVTACGSSWSCRNAEAFRKKTKQTPPKELEFYFQSRKRLYFRVVTQYLLQLRRMLTERVCLLAARGAGTGLVANRWLVFGNQRRLGWYIEPWHMGTAMTSPGDSQGRCSAGSMEELHSRLSGDELSAEAVRQCSHRTVLGPWGKGWPVGDQRAALTPKSGAEWGIVSPWQGTGGISAPQPDLLDVVLRKFPLYTNKVCSGMMRSDAFQQVQHSPRQQVRAVLPCRSGSRCWYWKAWLSVNMTSSVRSSGEDTAAASCWVCGAPLSSWKTTRVELDLRKRRTENGLQQPRSLVGAGLLWNLRLAGSEGPARGFLQLPRGRRNWLTYLLKSRKNECRNALCKSIRCTET